MNLLIYVPLLSPRLKYVFSFIFNDILKTEITFTLNKEEYAQSTLPKLSYARHPIGQELFFKSTSLLFDYKIKAKHIKKTDFGGFKVPFPVSEGALPFDIFAASFYFLSRYEEYIHLETSQTASYHFKNSLQYRLKILRTPIINNWALILKNILLKQYPDLVFGTKHFVFHPISFPQTAKVTKNNFIFNAITGIKSFIDKKLNARDEKLAVINKIISDNNGFNHSSDLMPHLDANFITELSIPKSYIKLTKDTKKIDFSMYYTDYAGFRAGTCTSFYWYDLQLEKKTQLLLHPVVTTDTYLLKNKTSDALLLQMNELVSSVKLVNGDLYFLSLSKSNDIRPE